MMDLLKAYAHQVVSYHPAAQRDELFAEVYDNLYEEFTDLRESEPGLSEAAFLNREKKHPMKYATRLVADGFNYLVGPRFYLSFLSSLKTALSIVVVFHVALAAVSVFAGNSVLTAALGMFTAVPETLLWVSAAVLGVFVAIERTGENATWLDNWDAAELKPVDSHQTISRFETSFDLGFSTLAFLWVIGIVRFPATMRHDGEWVTSWTANVPELVWLAAGVLLLFDIAFSLYRLRRTLWTRRMRLVTVVSNVLWLVLLGYLLTRPGLLSVAHEGAEPFLSFVEQALRGGLLVACAIIAWDTAVHAWRLLKHGQT